MIRLTGKEFTSFDVAATVRELKAQIIAAFVSNIYQLNSKTVLLKLHKTDKPATWLVLEAGRRINLTAYTVEKPSKPPAFCMALRKHLRNARLLDIEQYEFERVLVLSFKTEEGNMKLVLELFGEGNLILVNESGKIFQALVYKRMRDRNVIHGERFMFAPSSGKNPLKVEKDTFKKSLQTLGSIEVVRGLARFLSIGGMYTEEVLMRADVEKTRPCQQMSEQEIDAAHDSLWRLLSQVMNGSLEPCIVLDERERLVDVVPLKLLHYNTEAYKIQTYDTFNEALDVFYSKISVLEQAAEDVKADRLKTEVERLKRIIDDQQNVVASSRSQAEHQKRLGDAVYAHFSELQTVLERFILKGRKSKELSAEIAHAVAEKQKGVVPWTLFESFDRNEYAIKFRIEGLDFTLSLQKTPIESAAAFYEQGKRARQKMEGAQAALNDSLKRLEEVQAKIDQKQQAAVAKQAEAIEQLDKRKIQHKEWYEKFRSFMSSDGFLVVGGKDTVTNEVLIKKYTDPRDVVFHADIVGAPFVVIKTSGKKPTEQSLSEAGEFAAAFSRAWREGFASVDVYWVRPEQLSKGGPSGESVGHGAFVVRGERNWMRGVTLKVAIGVVFDQETGNARICGGPVEAVMAKTAIYTVIVPGDSEARELIKRVLMSLSEKVQKDKRETILAQSLESIREFVPFSKGNLMKT